MHLNSPDGRAVIAIKDGTVLAGSVSKRILAEARAWAGEHAQQL